MILKMVLELLLCVRKVCGGVFEGLMGGRSFSEAFSVVRKVSLTSGVFRGWRRCQVFFVFLMDNSTVG
jgi:hypothetical protein